MEEEHAIIDSMPQLVVRNLEPLLVRRLKERAVEHGVSAEEEHRQILRSVLLPPEDDSRYDILKQVLLDESGPDIEIEFDRLRDYPREIELS